MGDIVYKGNNKISQQPENWENVVATTLLLLFSEIYNRGTLQTRNQLWSTV